MKISVRYIQRIVKRTKPSRQGSSVDIRAQYVFKTPEVGPSLHNPVLTNAEAEKISQFSHMLCRIHDISDLTVGGGSTLVDGVLLPQPLKSPPPPLIADCDGGVTLRVSCDAILLDNDEGVVP